MKKIIFAIVFVVAIAGAFANKRAAKFDSADLYKKVAGTCTAICSSTGNQSCSFSGTVYQGLTNCQSVSPTEYTGTKYEPF